jgi:hypothetical protein
MSAAAPGLMRKKPQARARISNGHELLPGTDLRGSYPRFMRDTLESLINHCGGEAYITEPLRAVARRSAVLEAELVYLEAGFAALRAADKAPSTDDLDLYSRLANTQRRLLETLGWTRHQAVLTPSLDDYLRSRHADEVEAA